MQENPRNEKERRLSKGRLHLITSCTECQKRKQKCDQQQPCRHCARRYPPPRCVYPAREIATLQQNDCITPRIRSNQEKLSINQQSAELQATARETEPGSSSMKASPNAFLPNYKGSDNSPEILLKDELFEPLRPLDVGLVYQKLLTMMLAAPFPPSIDGSLELVRENSQSRGYLSEDHSKYNTEKLRRGRWQYSTGEISKTCFGISSVEPLHYLPIQPTVLNGELLQIFVKIITKFVVSVDGNPTPNIYNDEWVPYSIKTPLLAQIAIYTASCYQSEARKVPAGKSPVALRHKLKSISLLNETLQNHEQSTCNEAIAAVVYLTTNEWYWGFRRNVLAHLSGLKEMVRLRGGIEALDHDFLKKTTLLCDYHIACSFDTEPLLSRTVPRQPRLSAILMCQPNMNTPYFPSNGHFATDPDEIGIGKDTAIILDDMRFLLQCVINQVDLDADMPQLRDDGKLMSTSIWIQDRINHLSGPSDDFIYPNVRKAALIYCKAIAERTPLSRACTLQDLNQIWASMWRIPLSRWKEIPGVFIFILLSVNQAAQDTAHGRFLKSMLKSASFYVALENWEVIEGILNGFVKLQRWLRKKTFVEEVLPLRFRVDDAL